VYELTTPSVGGNKKQHKNFLSCAYVEFHILGFCSSLVIYDDVSVILW